MLSLPRPVTDDPSMEQARKNSRIEADGQLSVDAFRKACPEAAWPSATVDSVRFFGFAENLVDCCVATSPVAPSVWAKTVRLKMITSEHATSFPSASLHGVELVSCRGPPWTSVRGLPPTPLLLCVTMSTWTLYSRQGGSPDQWRRVGTLTTDPATDPMQQVNATLYPADRIGCCVTDDPSGTCFMLVWNPSPGHSQYKPALPAPWKLYSISDVALLFPDSHLDFPCLWSNINVLKTASPYWQRLFDAGFAETTNRLGMVNSRAGPHSREIARVLQEHRQGSSLFRPGQSMPNASTEKPVRYLVIKDGDLNEYEVVIDWIQSGRLVFGSLDRNIARGRPNCKRIYRLAHLLELDKLQQLALADLRCRLTLENLLPELFSKESLLYVRMRECILAEVRCHWQALKAAGSLLKLSTIMDNALKDGNAQSNVTETAMQLVAGL